MNKDGSFYHHPFTSMREQPLDHAGENWLASDQSLPFMDMLSAACCMRGGFGSGDEAALVAAIPAELCLPLECAKICRCVRDFSTARGVTHVMANLESVEQDERGWIRSVQTDSQGQLSADLFVDCTGFRGHLIAQTLETGFEDYSQYLLCNRAVTMHLPYDRFYPGFIRPYTTRQH